MAESNFRSWQDYNGESVAELESLFHTAETPLVERWTPENVRAEVLLLQGFPLDSSVATQSAFDKNEVQLVTSENVAHRLWICLDRKIQSVTVAALTPSPEDVVVCLDSALSDEAKLRLADRCTLETI